jgi:phosphohistidine phosphatase
MTELLILRHAKSSWDNPGLDDHDRPLNRRGRRDAPRIGKLMAAEDLLPDAVICSTACRTVETWELLSNAAGCDLKPRYESSVYLASAGDLLEQARTFPPDCRRGMIIGHNPGLESLVNRLTGKRVTLPTASLVLVAIRGGWDDLRSGRFIRQWKPKEIDI